jgi:hypothetical protein
MNSYEQEQGALERLGIPVETTPPDGVMTSGQARSVRFRIGRPQGYAFGDVESFIFDHIQPTLDWYANALHQRDLAVHRLGELVDKLEVDLQNANAQLDNKQYNEALGVAVGMAETDDETDVLMARIKELERALATAQQNQSDTSNAPIQAPDGEYYSREEVEGFIASAVAEAEARKEAEIAERGYYTQEQVEQILAEAAPAAPTGTVYSQEELDASIAEAEARGKAAAQPAEDVYTHGQVEEFIATAVAEAEAAKDAKTAEALQQLSAEKDKERAAAIADAEQSTTGYTQEEFDAAIEKAKAETEAAVLASIPEESQPVDPVDELTDEGDLKYRAENKTLRAAVDQWKTYAQELEEYVAQLDGSASEQPQVTTEINAATGRPLPKLRPEDL